MDIDCMTDGVVEASKYRYPAPLELTKVPKHLHPDSVIIFPQRPRDAEESVYGSQTEIVSLDDYLSRYRSYGVSF